MVIKVKLGVVFVQDKWRHPRGENWREKNIRKKEELEESSKITVNKVFFSIKSCAILILGSQEAKQMLNKFHPHSVTPFHVSNCTGSVFTLTSKTTSIRVNIYRGCWQPLSLSLSLSCMCTHTHTQPLFTHRTFVSCEHRTANIVSSTTAWSSFSLNFILKF